MSAPDWTPTDLGTDTAHPARVYDCFLGGKDHFAVDREVARQTLEVIPYAPTMARENRGFLARAVRHLAADAGVRQFLDIGTGLPTSPNVHEIAQRAAPDSRVVYVDNDPLVLVHARALFTSTPQGRTAYIDADLRAPGTILDAPELRDTLDLSRPVALSLVAILHFVPDEDDAHGIVRQLVDALPSGSFLVLSHATGDLAGERMRRAVGVYHRSGMHTQLRSRAEVERFFTGLDLVEPGVAVAHRWRPDAGTDRSVPDDEVSVYAGVGRKP
ncbi:SAM-dependent methyltransferase [Streptomyces capparidis]